MKPKFNANKLKKLLKPLMKYEKFLESIYAYGSAVTKKSGNDIDILIIVNDSANVPEELLMLIERETKVIDEKAGKAGMQLHFQSPKRLSKWWHLVLDGEPWIVTSLNIPYVVYDKKGLITEISKFLKKEKTYKKEEKAEHLLERSDEGSLKNRQLLLSTIHTLSDAATEASQILLLFNGKFILNKKKIINELENHYIHLIGKEIIGNYKEIVDLDEKMEKGTLSSFTAENLDYYLENIKSYIAKIEAMLSKK